MRDFTESGTALFLGEGMVGTTVLFTIQRAGYGLPYEGVRQEVIDGSEQFVVEVADLDALLSLVDKTGSEIIVRRGSYGNATVPHLIIYDDYLE